MNIEVNGRPIHAATGGVEPSAEDPVVILLHGAGMNSTIWQLQTRYLAHRGLQAIAVDLPGHGRSGGDPLDSIADMAQFVVDLMDAAGWPAAGLVGHSMGALVALDAAALLGERCTSLTLMGAAAAMPVHPQLLEDASNDLPAAAALMAAWGHAKPAHVGQNPTPGMWMTGGARALVERSDPGVLRSDFDACAAYDNTEAAAAAVRCPVTLIIGHGDKMTPPKASRALAAMLAGGDGARPVELIELDGVGHSMMTEAPREVRSAILAAQSFRSR